MKFGKYLAMAVVAMTIVSCNKKAESAESAEAATTEQTEEKASNATFDQAKYAEVIDHLKNFSVTEADYEPAIAMYNDIITYFETKYTEEQLKDVTQHVMHEEEVLGAEDYEIFKLLNMVSNNFCMLDLGANQKAWEDAWGRRKF
ncbi:MAG: hypothetical protein MJZ60_02025 [Bacteroidaceae bacterium]|nr:hypothetical protein [Bacteroidaceae bacterium]